jgi:hypothetical protein
LGVAAVPAETPARPGGAVFHALAESLPRQMGLSDVVARAVAVAAAPAGTVAAPVANAARAVIATALDGERPVTAEAVRRAIESSGIAAEREGEALVLVPTATPQLAQTAPATARPVLDLKTALQLLRSVLGGVAPPTDGVDAPATDAARPPPPRRGEKPVAESSRPLPQPLAGGADQAAALGALARAAEGAVARIRLAQLVSLAPEASRGDGARADPAAPAQLHLELPILFAERAATLSAVVERGARSPHAADPAAPAWTFTFAVDLGEEGPVTGRVALSRDGRVGVVVRAEKESAVRALRARLDGVREAFRAAGLTLSELDFGLGARLPGRDRPSHFVDTSA